MIRNEAMLEPNFDPVPTAVQIGRCGIPAQAGRRDAPGTARLGVKENAVSFYFREGALEATSAMMAV
jgi:hypothetical protein